VLAANQKTENRMKNLFILIVILFLSFKNKDASITTSEFVAKIASSNPKSSSETISNNSDFLRTVLYKGTLNGTIKIWLYLKEQEHPCGGSLTFLYAMYKYDNQEKWILLSVTTDKLKKKYCMVEDNFSGVLFLEENESKFNGNWISPDTKKQFKIELEKVDLNKTTIEKLDETLFDDLLYNKNDC